MAKQAEDYRMQFGKYAGQTLGEILALDAGYIDWLTTCDLRRYPMCQAAAFIVARRHQDTIKRHSNAGSSGRWSDDMDVTTREMIASLHSKTCPACGGPKKSGNTLCGKDYGLLNVRQRNDLYKPVGKGYEEAVLMAIAELGVPKFIKASPPPAPPTPAVAKVGKAQDQLSLFGGGGPREGMGR